MYLYVCTQVGSVHADQEVPSSITLDFVFEAGSFPMQVQGPACLASSALGLWVQTTSPSFLRWVLGTQVQGLLAAWQALYCLVALPVPWISYFNEMLKRF